MISGADGYVLRCSSWMFSLDVLLGMFQLVLLVGKKLVLWKSLILICLSPVN